MGMAAAVEGAAPAGSGRWVSRVAEPSRYDGALPVRRSPPGTVEPSSAAVPAELSVPHGVTWRG